MTSLERDAHTELTVRCRTVWETTPEAYCSQSEPSKRSGLAYAEVSLSPL